MRVVVMGTPEFAVPSLQALAATHEVVCVYSRPDAVSGRGGQARPSPVKAAARELRLEVRTPNTLRDIDELAHLRSLSADAILVAAYGLILPPDALDAARLGAINVHASLLPRWRGAAPIQRAILAGDEFAGVSIMKMEEGLDTGPYCLQVSTPIGSANAVELTERLAHLGAKALVRALPAIVDGSAVWTVQEVSQVTYADKIAKSDVAIDPGMSVAQALLRVRASSPAAPSRIVLGGRGATVMRAEVDETALQPAAVGASKSALLLGMADGTLAVTEIKPDGKGVMQASAWARGIRDLASLTWEAGR